MKYTITFGGDGIGPEVINEAVKFLMLLQKIQSRNNWTPALTGACAIDAVGVPYPDETHEIWLAADVLFGAIGHQNDNDPSAKVRPEQGLLLMRKKLGLFANVRHFHLPSLIDNSP
jgi:3-isopropylmalate dehydrogenase